MGEGCVEEAQRLVQNLCSFGMTIQHELTVSEESDDA